MAKTKSPKKGRSIYLDPSTDSKLVEIANENGVSIGNVVKELLDEKQSKESHDDSVLPRS